VIFLAYASYISRATFRPKSRSGAKRAAIFDRIADALFYRPVRLPGFLARVALLVMVAVLSYFAGAYAGMVVVKAPLPATLFVGAALASWAQSDPD
jgi:hypothetical protein